MAMKTVTMKDTAQTSEKAPPDYYA